jgi:hypothetical protein
MQEKTEFTFEDAYKIQKEQLQDWANKLNYETYVTLAQWVEFCNKKADYKDPCSVIRGFSLDNFVINYQQNIKTKYNAPEIFNKKYLICYKEDGEALDCAMSIKDANLIIWNYELEEKKSKLYTPNCYEIQLNGNYKNS